MVIPFPVIAHRRAFGHLLHHIQGYMAPIWPFFCCSHGKFQAAKGFAHIAASRLRKIIQSIFRDVHRGL